MFDIIGDCDSRMIPVSLYLIWLLIVLFCTGSMGKRFLQALGNGRQLAKSTHQAGGDISAIFLLGLVLITSLISVVSLFHPIDFKVHVVLSALIVCAGGRELWHFIKTFSFHRLGMKSWGLRLAGAACLGALIFVATDKTTHYDTGLYHAQMVKWNKAFGVVPGLANLQGRFGFNSAWDVFASYVDQGYFSGRSFHLVGLLIAVIFLLACFQGFQQVLDGNRSLGTFLRCLGIPVLLHDYRSLLPSLSTDWPAALLLYYLVILSVEWIERTHINPNSTSGERIWELGLAAALCAFAVTIKLSSLPVLLLLLLWLRSAPNKPRAVLLILVPAACITIPFVARNIILTGYPIYPVTAVDPFWVDWKVPRTDVHLMTSSIKYWAINPVDDWYRAKEMGLAEQIHTWLKYRGEEAAPLLPWLGLGATTWLGVMALGKARRRSDFIPQCAICCTLLIGILFSLMNAPQPRFIVGSCLAFGLLPSAWLVHVLIGSAAGSAMRWKLVAYLLVAGCTLWMVRNAGVKRMIAEKGTPLWKTADLPVVKVKNVQSEYGVVVKIPVEGDQAWDAALPTTTPFGFDPWLQMRGQTLQQGFRVTKAGFSIGRESLQQ